MRAIYRKEMSSYFRSLAAYLYFALYIAASGVYYSLICIAYGYTDFSKYVFKNITILYIIIVPILTMRLLAEEKKQRTDQLLYTSPVRVSGIVLGKYFAVLTLLAMTLVVSIAEAALLSTFGQVSWKSIFTGCLGYYLLGVSFLAIGLFISAITENQMIAAAGSFGVVLLCILLPNLSAVVPTNAKYTYIICAFAALVLAGYFYDETKSLLAAFIVALLGGGTILVAHFVKPALFENGIAKMIDWFSLVKRYDDFTAGILNVSSIVYYISFAAVFLFLTMQTIERRRWN